MYLLISNDHYPDDICIVAHSRGVLEEIALSLFEEDWFEMYNVLYSTDFWKQDDDAILKYSFLRALDGMDCVKLIELPIPIEEQILFNKS